MFFRVSNSSAGDTTALTINSAGNTTFGGSLDVGTFTLSGSGIIADAGMTLQTNSGGVNAITLASNGNATFAGDINSSGLTVDYTGNRTGDAGILVTNDNDDWGIKVDKDGTTDYGILSQTDGENAIVVRNASGVNKIQLQGDGDASFAGDISVANANITTAIDVGSFIYVGGNNSIFAENNLRFKSAGAAYIDHNTTGQSIKFRLSNSSSLDVTPLEITPSYAVFNGNLTVTGDLTVSGTNTILNTQTVEVEDNIIVLNKTQSDNSATAATSGISIYRGLDASDNAITEASLIFDDADDTWDLTNNLQVGGNATFAGTVTGGNGTFTNLTINATEKLRFDGAGGHTYIEEDSNDTLIFATGGTTRLTLDANATFGGTVTAATYYKSSGTSAVLGTNSSGEVLLRPTAWNLSTAQSSFTTTLATIGTNATFAGAITATKDSQAQGIFQGWSTTGANGASGAIRLGGNSAYQGRIDYAADGDTEFMFDNTYASGIYTFSIAGSEKLRIDASGHVGIGVTPSTIWSSSYEALQIGLGGSIYGHSSAGSSVNLGANIVYEGTAPNYYDKYLTSSTATKYEQDAGSHIWSTATSGTAGDVVTWSENLRINNSGNATFGGNISTAVNKRISIGTWDNSAFTSGNAEGYYVSSGTPMLILDESDQSKTGYVGVSGGNMYVGGVVTSLVLQSGNGSSALTIDSSQDATFAGDARFNQRVRIGDVTGLSNRGAVRIDTRGDAPADLLYGRDTAGTATSWTGVYWGLSSRGSSEGNAFKVYRGSGHDSPYNSEAVALKFDPNLKATFAGDVQIDGSITGAGAFVPVGGGTFTGDVNITNGTVDGTDFASNRLLRLQNTSTTDGSRMGITFQGNSTIGSGLAWIEGVSDDQSAGHTSIRMSTYNGSWHEDAFILGADGNATFGGDVTINGIGTWNTPTGGVAFNVDAFTDGFGVIRFRTNGNASKWDVGMNNSNHFYIGNNGVNTAFEIEEASSNATFGGNVYLKAASNEGNLFFGTGDASYKIFGGGTFGYMGYDTGGYHKFNTSGTERLRVLADGQFWIKLNSTTSGREGSISNDNDKLQIFGSRHGGTSNYVSIWADGANENARFYSTTTVFYEKVGVAGKIPTYGLTLAQGTSANNKIAWTDGTPNFAASIYANSSNDKLTFATKNSSNAETTAVEIDINQKTTFKGDVQIDGTLSGAGAFVPVSGGTFTGRISHPHKKYCDVSISNSYVRVYSTGVTNSQLVTIVRLTGTAHGTSHVGSFTAKIMVGHYQDVQIESMQGFYPDDTNNATIPTLKVEGDGNGQYTLSMKIDSSNAATYYFTIESLTDQTSITTLPSSTASTTISHEHECTQGKNLSHLGRSGQSKIFKIQGDADFNGTLNVVNHANTNSIATQFMNGKKTSGTGPFGELIFSNNNDSVATVAGFRDGADNKGSLVFQTQDGSNGFGTRLTIDSAGAATFAGNINLNDGTSSKIQFANGANTRKIVLWEGFDNDYQFYGFGIESSTLVYSTYSAGDDHVFFVGVNSSSRSELMRIKSTGDVEVAQKINVKGGQIITPGGVNLALNPNTGLVTVGGVMNTTGTGTNKFTGSLVLGSPSNGNAVNMLTIASGTNGDGIFLTGLGNHYGMGTGHYKSIDYQYSNTDSSFGSAIRFVTADSTLHGGQIELWTDNSSGTLTKALTLDKSQNAIFTGNVGINQDPSTKLHVTAGSAIADEIILRLSGGRTGFDGANEADVEHSIVFDACAYKGTTGIVQRDAAKIAIEKDGSWNEADVGTGTRASLVFSTNNGTIDSSDLAERMRIRPSGNSYFNYSNSTIETYGSGVYGGKVVIKASGAEALSLLNNSIGGASQVALNFTNEFVANQYNFIARIIAEPEQSWTGTASTRDARLSFFTSKNGSAGEKMRIDSSGNVMVNTDNPLVADSATETGLVLGGARNLLHVSRQDADPARFNRIGTNGRVVSLTRNGTDVGGFGVDGTNMTFEIGSSEKMRLASGGEFLIGTETAVADVKLRIVQPDNQWPMQIVSSYAYGLSIDTSLGQDSNAGSLQIYPNSGGGFIVRNDSKVGIGESTPFGKLHIKTSDTGVTSASAQGNLLVLEDSENGLSILSSTAGAGYINFGDSDDNDVGMIIYGHSSNSLDFWTNAAHRMRLTSGGDLHVDGDIIAYSTTVSDKRLKDDVKPLESSLDKVMNLKGVEYVWNNGSRKGQKDIGFIAQEVEEIIPEIVREKEVIFNKEENYKTVDYEKITAVLVEAMKEQQDQINDLKKEIQTLKSK
jgi:hypothetical protein